MEQQGNNTQGTGMPYPVNPMVAGQAQPPPSTQPAQPIDDLPSGSSSSSSLQTPQHHPLAYQQVNPQKDQGLQAFWTQKYDEIQRTTDFSNHGLPLARVKKVMKSEEDCMVSKEASVIVAKASEIFVQELTLRSWNHVEEDSRRTLRRSDIAASVETTEIFDFLAHVVPGVDLNAMEAASGGGSLPAPVMPPPSVGLPYYYMAGPPQMGAHPTAVYGQQVGPPFMAPQIWPQRPPPPPPAVMPPHSEGLPNYYMAGPPPQMWPQHPPPPPPAVMPPHSEGLPNYYMAGPPPQMWPQHPPPPPPVMPPHSEGLPNYFMAGQPQMGAPWMGPTAVYGQQAGTPFTAPQVWPRHPPPPPPPPGTS